MRSVIVLLLYAGAATCALSACDRQSTPGGQANGTVNAASSDEAAPDEVKPSESAGEEHDGAFQYSVDRSKAGTPAPAIAFKDADGKRVTLQQLAGQPLLVNLWATWCAPCVAEMPTLDAVAGGYAGKGLKVLTISQDVQEKQVAPFFAKRGFAHLKPWTDSENALGLHYATGMLPTSVLYDAKGREVARVIGAMDWQGDEAKSLLDAALKAG